MLLQNNEPETKWYWFDMLHYRKTGEFAKNLVAIAQSGTDRQRAYAYGYLSHITTDLVGHAYVNQIVGGPYRLHSQRHTVVENFMDTRQVFEEDGSSVNQTLLDKLSMPDTYEPLHEEICDMLHQAFINTYTNPAERPQRVNLETDASGNHIGESGFLLRTYTMSMQAKGQFTLTRLWLCNQQSREMELRWLAVSWYEMILLGGY